jgi:hypothetical protein
MVKKITVYGTYKARVPVKQQVWKRRKDAKYQRYWVLTSQKKTVEMKGRYEFHGDGKDLYTSRKSSKNYGKTIIFERLHHHF